MMLYELREIPDPDFPEEVETFPKLYAVHSTSWLGAAAQMVRVIARSDKGLNVDNLTIADILGMLD